MDATSLDRLFGYHNAFEHSVTLWISIAIAVVLVCAAVVVEILGKRELIQQAAFKELRLRIRSWFILAPCILVPIYMGSAWVILAVLILSVLCYREYARATGLFRYSWISFWALVGIFAVNLAVADHWYGFFAALPVLGVVWIAASAIFSDQPSGYIQRVALGIFGYLLFGVCMGHLGYLANDANYRPILLLLFLCVETNDVFAYLSGKLIGRRKLAPNTSPNKTIGGALGALVGTSLLFLFLGGPIFEGTRMSSPVLLIFLGIIVSVAGQLGDLMLSSIKRDVGVKDMGVAIPGHGGFLDRFDSIILAAPAYFHFVGYFNGIGLDQPDRIFM